MPDQLPSAILDSTNSFDSIFALDLDTKQRFDNILTNQQKPIDYPIPDYNKDHTPQGLPQDDLLNPQKMAGTIGEGLFSTDPRIAAYATDKLRQNQSKLPVNQGIGVPSRFEYNKAMDKFLSGDYGYNPYMSLEDNEDFNYRYDYLSDNVFKRFASNIGTGTTRFLGSVLLKLGQTAGYLGSMVGNGIQELYDKDNHFMADVADNSLSRWFEGLEEDMKNSNLLQVYKPQGWEDKGFFQKLGNGAFWTDEVADGAAFMGEMVASMYLMGGLGKIGAVGRLGATEINLTKALGRLGGAGRYAGKGLDVALKTATGADNLSGIGRWAFATTSESAFEASQLYKTRKDELKAERQAGKNNYTDQEIEAISGDSAAASFKANMLILSASNAFENRFIFNPLFKKLGGRTPNPRGRLIDVSAGTSSLDELAQASRRTNNYSTWLGKKLNWKDANSRLRFYGSRGLTATAVEGFWEENAQLAVERLAGADNLSFSTFAEKLKNQTFGALQGTDPEASTNIGLGGLIGIGGTSIVSKVRGGDRLFQGERRQREEDTLKAVEIYENSRRNFLSFQDIYQRDPQTKKPLLDEDGNLQIDPVKAAGVFDGINAFVSKQEAASKADDPLFRKQLQDNAMMDYVVAAKNAGIFDRASKRFAALGEINQADLVNLGFDPNTTVDSAYLKDSMKEFGKIYDEVQSSPSARLSKDDTIQDEMSRKNALYKSRAAVYSTSKLINEFQSKMLDRDFPSVFDPEAEGSTSEIQQYNSLIFQKEGLEQWAGLTKEHGNFYNDFVRDQTRRIDTEMARLEAILDDMMESTDLNIQVTPRGFVVSAHKYDHLKPSAADVLSEVAGESQKRTIARLRNDMKSRRALMETDMNMDIEFNAQRKHAHYTNTHAQYQYLSNQFANLQSGVKNYKAYLDYEDSIQKKDAAAQAANQPGPEAAPVEAPATAAAPTTPAETPQAPAAPPLTEKQVVESEDVVNTLFKLLSNNFDAFTSNSEPDLETLAQYINEKVDPNRAAVESTVLSFMSDRGDIILNQIANNTFNKEKDASVEAYTKATRFMEELIPMLTDEALGNKVLDYMDSVDGAMENYKPVQVELTAEESAAIEALGPLDLTQGRLAPYAAILQDPSASNQDKKDALRYISDQLLDPKTGDEIGIMLGRRATEAIEALGYPAPTTEESNDFQARMAETEKENAVSDLAQRAAALQDFIDRTVSGADMTSPEDRQFYENNKNEIESALKTRRAQEEQAPTQPRVEPRPLGMPVLDALKETSPFYSDAELESVMSHTLDEVMGAMEAVLREFRNPTLGMVKESWLVRRAAAELYARTGEKVFLRSEESWNAPLRPFYNSLSRALLETTEFNPIPTERESLEAEIAELQNDLKNLQDALKEATDAKAVQDDIARAAAEQARVVITQPERQQLAQELGVTEEEAVQQVANAATTEIVTGTTVATPKKSSIFRRILDALKRALLTLFAAGTLWTGAGGTTIANGKVNWSSDTLVERTVSVLPEEQEQWAKRFLEKKGVYESQDAVIAVTEDISESIAPITEDDGRVKPTLEILGTVPDSYNSQDSLISYRSTWNNSDGFEYVAGPNRGQSKGVRSIPGVIGVGHFLLDASLYGEGQYSHPYNANFLAKARKSNEYIPAFRRTAPGRVSVSYKLPSELDSTDIVVSPLRQFKFSDISWEKAGPVAGFAKTVKEVKRKDGSGTNLIFKDANGYSRFSGGSIVFIFNNNGNRLVIDFAGSINMIRKEGDRIMAEYNIEPQELTVGYHDVGSFSAKPKAKGGTLYTSQYSGYNNSNITGGALLIPINDKSSERTPGASLMTLLPILGLIRRRRQSGDPITDADIEAIKTTIAQVQTRISDVQKKIDDIKNEIALTIAGYETELELARDVLSYPDITNNQNVVNAALDEISAYPAEISKLKAELASFAPVMEPEGPINLPPIVRLPIEVRVSDRFVKRYPTEIAGLNTKLLIELASIEYTNKDILPASYYNEQERLLNEYPEAEKFHSETEIEMTRQEAEFFQRNPGFADQFVNAIAYSDESVGVDFDNDAIEAAQAFLRSAEQIVDTYQLSLFEPAAQTQAQQATADTEGSGIQEETPTPPAIPPTPPKVAENSEEEFARQQNFLDVQVDQAKLNRLFTFPQNQPEEIIMEGSKPKIVDGAIQLKTSGDQGNQLLRQHNILKRMGNKNNILNFWSVDDDENPMFKIKLELAGVRNEARYAPWVYNTAKGKTSPATGKPYGFPYIVAMVVDQIGNYVYFDDNGNVSTKTKGKPFGFPYAVEDYKSENLNTSRRGVQLGTGEPLNGSHGFLNDDPLRDLSTALQRGVDLYGSIDQVTDGRLSTYNVDNTGTNYTRDYKLRSVQQMMQDGDISDDATFVLTSGNFVTYPLTTASDTEPQEIKVGQAFLFDERSGLKLPLRGKKLKDLTIDGKPFITDQLKEAIEGLDRDRRVTVDKEYSTPETQQFMENLYNTLRLLVYSRDTPVFLSEDKTAITVLDQRVNPKSLMDTEVNYTKTTDVSIISNPFEVDSEGFSYEDFVKENFMSGAIPAEVTKGQKSFEKLNRRIIFTLEKDHQEVLDAIGAESAPKKPIRMQTTDFSKFVNKTYKKKGGTSTVTITGYADGNFTIAGPSGEVKQSVNDFMKSLRSLEEVKLPTPSEEVKEDFENNIKLSEAEQKELNERAKNFSKEDEDNLNFNC
jgi:hypothetical protein